MKRSAPSATTQRKDKHRFVDCPQCNATVRSDNLPRHLNTHQPYVPCQKCTQSVRQDKMDRHLILCKDDVDERLCNRRNVELLPDCTTSSINGYFRSFELNIQNKAHILQLGTLKIGVT